jgi:type II secretory pathway pseudopilin PulG
MYQKTRNSKNAFTILELVVVIIVIAILIFTTINYSNTMSVNAKNRITKNKLKIIYLALGQYLTINKRLPCPISLTIPKNQVMSQNLSTSGNCSDSNLCNNNKCYGGVPVRDLDLSAEISEDGFGNKIFYMVNQQYASSNNFGTRLIGNVNNFNIAEQLNTNTTRTIINTSNNLGAIVIIASSGANKSYSYQSKNHLTSCGAVNTCNYNNIISSNPSEQNNRIVLGTSNIYPTTLIVNDYSNPNFDDIITYKTEDDFSFDFNQFYLQKCTGAGDFIACNDLSYNLQNTSSCFDFISKRAKCYQANVCRFLFDCRL